jgi:hypothetical protein
MYEAPTIIELGPVADITLAGGFSGDLDGNYPPGTDSEGGLFS